MQDIMEYYGEVTVKHKTKRSTTLIKTHNTGTDELFKLICQSLAGYSLDSRVPTYLTLIDTNDIVLISPEYIPLTGKSYQKDTNGWYVRFNAEIEFTQLRTNLSSTSVAKFQICSGDTDRTVLAEVSIDAQELNISEGVVVLVEWKMYVKNKVGA